MGASGECAFQICHGEKEHETCHAFAFLAEYRNSGVVTFIVNHQGTVFQKDLMTRHGRHRQGDDLVQRRQEVNQGRCD
jgi:hypothetical protein